MRRVLALILRGRVLVSGSALAATPFLTNRMGSTATKVTLSDEALMKDYDQEASTGCKRRVS